MDHVRVSFSGVRHETHMVYVCSWLRWFVEHADSRVELVDLDDEARVSPRNLERFVPDGVATVSASGASEGSTSILVTIGSPPFRLAVPRPPRSRVVVVDEGLGSFGTFRTRWAAIRREGQGSVRSFIVAGARGASRRYLAGQRWRLYHHGDAGWLPNEAIASEFARHRPAIEPGEHVVLLTQPWVELGLIDEAEQRHHVDRIAAAVESIGRRLVVVPHPLEAADRYVSFLPVHQRGPAEMDPFVVGAAAVIGDCSTALLNLAAMFGVRTFRVVQPVRAGTRLPMSAAQQSLFETFVGLPMSIGRLADHIGR